MLKGIDHFVVVVSDLEAAIKSYGELGFTVVRGGKHNIGTHNALIAFRRWLIHRADRVSRAGGRTSVVRRDEQKRRHRGFLRADR